jgi:hypothetical protein
MCEVGIYNTSKRDKVVPVGSEISIVPMAVAKIEESPRPLMARGGMGCKSRKSVRTDDI